MALFEAFFVARASPPGQGGSGAPPPPRLAPFCRFAPPGVRANGGAPTVENAVSFCFPLGADSVKPSAYLVTAEFTFTLTGGDGGRLHGVCRRTHDPTFRPAAGERGTVKRWPQVLCILSPHCWQPFFSKALEVVEQLLAPHAGCEALPPDAPAALFLASLPAQLAVAAAGRPELPLGAVLRVPLPLSGAPVVVDRMRRALAPPGQPGAQLGLSADAIELEVPPDLGNGAANSGISLARLLWFLTPRQAVTLVASLLLERRIILVARDADTVSAAVHAANALLYPFSWQHIYLPLLPLALKDYLAAPMPYLVGIQADCLPLLRGTLLEEVVMFDLDCLGSCTPELGSPTDDYFQLPFARELEDVFEVVRDHIQSPTEFDSTPKCTELLQDFFLRLVGSYRKYVRQDDEVTPAALALGIDRPPASAAAFSPGGGSAAGSRAGSVNGREERAVEEENPRAHGFVFDQAAFILAHRRKAKVAAFLQQFRNSQMLEVFITERLKLASEGYATADRFELKVAERSARQGVRIAGVALPTAVAGSKGRLGNLLRKAGAAVKQGGGALVASIKQAGTSQQEEVMIGRAVSGPAVARVSPNAHTLGLARRSASSFSSSRTHSRSSSFNNLSRPSANLAAMNGGVQPSLEQLRPDMFFGADSDDESVASEASAEPPRLSPSQARSSAGPLGAGMGRSFGSLFQVPSSGAYSPPVLSLPPLGVGSRASGPMQHGGTMRMSVQHGASRLGATDQQSEPAGGMAAAAAYSPSKPGSGSVALEAVADRRSAAVAAGAVAVSAAGLASAAGAASPALADLVSPAQEAARWRQRQYAQNHPHAGPTPQQLFGSPARLATQQGSSAVETPKGWATFEDAAPASTSYGSPAAGQEPGGRAPIVLAPAEGPLGAAALGSAVLRQTSGLVDGAAASQQVQPSPYQAPGWLHPAPQPAAWEQAPAQTQQQPQQPEKHQQQASAAMVQLHQQQQQQQDVHPVHLQVADAPPPAVQQQQQPKQLAAQHAPQSVLFEGMAAGWATFGEPPASALPAHPPLPPMCRDSIHSPLAQGFAAVNRHTSSGAAPSPVGASLSLSGSASGGMVPLRSSSSSAASGASLQHSPLSVTQDAFADAVSLAAAQASEQLASPRRRSSAGGSLPPPPPVLQGQLSGAAWRSSSTSSWAEYAAAPAAEHGDPASSNPFAPQAPLRTQRTTSWGDWGSASAGSGKGQPVGGPLHSQRTSSWGDWGSAPASAAKAPPMQPAGAPPPTSSVSPLGAELAALRF